MSSLVVAPIGPLGGRVVIPGDKSISHRALLFSGLARGRSRIRGLLQARDVQATVRCLQAMGVEIQTEKDTLFVTGRAGCLDAPGTDLDCGNSGTTMRLLCGILASQPFEAVLAGDVHLSQRPMGRVTGPLSEMGARFEGPDGGTRAPLRVFGGSLVAGRYQSPVASAQVKSAMILATLGAEGHLEFREPRRSRDHTERMLTAMGVRMRWDEDWLQMPAGQVPQARDITVPADPSSAAFFLVAASIVPGSDLLMEGVGVNPTRSGLIETLCEMGADIEQGNPREVSGEPVADLRVRYAGLRGVHLEASRIPSMIDEIPVLAVAAACAEGETVISEAGELRVKESDRIATTVAGLAALGIEVEEHTEGMRIVGGNLSGAEVDSRGDHRIAMAFAVAGLAATGETRVCDTDNVATSFPEFPSLLAGLGHG